MVSAQWRADGAVSRRAVLTAFGFGAASVLVTGCSSSATPRSRSSPAAPEEPLTAASWIRQRGANYFIAHRGSGDVYPEHSMPAYQAAVDAGAQCMEVSVVTTSDGVLICMHDLTYDRTTTGHGTIADQPASVLNRIGISQPQLGPFWTRPPLPEVPRLREVLQRFGGRCVICLEAKDDRAYAPMMAMVEQLGLRDSIIVKAYWTSRRIAEAKAAGYPVFVYLGPDDMTTARIAKVAGTLDTARDCIVLPATPGDDLTYYPDSLVAAAVAHHVPVWVYPIHRRTEAAHYFALGAAGAVTSSFPYVSTSTASATRDAWAGKRIVPGEITRHPERADVAPQWTDTDELTLAVPGMQQFLTLGQLSPITAAHGSYQVGFDASWRVLPVDRTSDVTLAFGHGDDAYYEQWLGRSDGYHATLQPDGRLTLYRHDAGRKDGIPLAAADTPAVAAGQWLTLRLDVGPETISWTRTDTDPPVTVRARDSAYRGGYLHVGRSAYDDHVELALRNLRVELS